jgi:hypothetical protein
MSQDQNGKTGEAGTQTEVAVNAKRRQHSAEYKLRILHDVDECKVKGKQNKFRSTTLAGS